VTTAKAFQNGKWQRANGQCVVAISNQPSAFSEYHKVTPTRLTADGYEGIAI
jgi:hypothetical protein